MGMQVVGKLKEAHKKFAKDYRKKFRSTYRPKRLMSSPKPPTIYSPPPLSYGPPGSYSPPTMNGYLPPPSYDPPMVNFDDAPTAVYGVTFRVRRAYMCGEKGMDCDTLEAQGKVVDCEISRFRQIIFSISTNIVAPFMVEESSLAKLCVSLMILIFFCKITVFILFYIFYYFRRPV